VAAPEPPAIDAPHDAAAVGTELKGAPAVHEPDADHDHRDPEDQGRKGEHGIHG
jgi:hypothetical protein